MDCLENIDFTLRSKDHYTLTGKHRRLSLQADSYKRSNLYRGQIIGFEGNDGLPFYCMRLELTDVDLISVFQRLVEKVTGKVYSKERIIVSAQFRDDTDPFKVRGLFLLVTELYKDGDWCLRAEYIRGQDEV